MVRFGFLSVLAVAALFVLQACNKGKSDCGFIAPKMIFVGYSLDEADTMIIKRYEKNGLFNTVVDTVLIPKADIIRTVVGRDSVVLTSNKYTKINYDFYTNDWEIIFPGADRSVRISDITPRFTQEREASAHCQSYAAGVKFDGMDYSFDSWFTDTYKVYSTR